MYYTLLGLGPMVTSDSIGPYPYIRFGQRVKPPKLSINVVVSSSPQFSKSTMDTLKWSDLPKELWPIIGTFLHSRVEVIRFRSVCSLWRSSRPSFQRPPPPPPLPLKFSPAVAGEPKIEALLFQSTTYRMESLLDKNHCGHSSRSKPWLMKLEEDPNSGQMRLVHPVNSSPLRYSPNATSKMFSLLEFRVVELRKSYVLKFGNHNVTVKSVQRLVVMPCEILDNDNVYMIFMIYNEGKLGFARFGDEKLTRVDEQNAHYDDLIVYKGQCYVVDKWGTISWVSSALQVVQFSPPLCGFGDWKHLVECNGDLYVVDEFFDKVSYQGNRVVHQNQDNELLTWRYSNRDSGAEAIDFKVYKLDQEWGRWVDVKDLGNHIFILSNDGSFSVSSREFAQVKGNCILYTGSVLPGRRFSDRRVFNLENGRISSLASVCSQMFHPPSTWLTP